MTNFNVQTNKEMVKLGSFSAIWEVAITWTVQEQSALWLRVASRPDNADEELGMNPGGSPNMKNADQHGIVNPPAGLKHLRRTDRR